MDTTIPNEFTEYKHTERELAESKILNDIQKQGIMNLRADVAKQMLRLIYDPLNPHDFGLQQANLFGQLAAFNYLLEADTEARAALVQLAVQESNQF